MLSEKLFYFNREGSFDHQIDLGLGLESRSPRATTPDGNAPGIRRERLAEHHRVRLHDLPAAVAVSIS